MKIGKYTVDVEGFVVCVGSSLIQAAMFLMLATLFINLALSFELTNTIATLVIGGGITAGGGIIALSLMIKYFAKTVTKAEVKS